MEADEVRRSNEGVRGRRDNQVVGRANLRGRIIAKTNEEIALGRGNRADRYASFKPKFLLVRETRSTANHAERTGIRSNDDLLRIGRVEQFDDATVLGRIGNSRSRISKTGPSANARSGVQSRLAREDKVILDHVATGSNTAAISLD
jgi:hypothetical protein